MIEVRGGETRGARSALHFRGRGPSGNFWKGVEAPRGFSGDIDLTGEGVEIPPKCSRPRHKRLSDLATMLALLIIGAHGFLRKADKLDGPAGQGLHALA